MKLWFLNIPENSVKFGSREALICGFNFSRWTRVSILKNSEEQWSFDLWFSILYWILKLDFVYKMCSSCVFFKFGNNFIKLDFAILYKQFLETICGNCSSNLESSSNLIMIYGTLYLHSSLNPRSWNSSNPRIWNPSNLLVSNVCSKNQP